MTLFPLRNMFDVRIQKSESNKGNESGKSTGESGKVDNTLTDAQKSRLNALENTINDHLTDGDFSGTLRDLQGIQFQMAEVDILII